MATLIDWLSCHVAVSSSTTLATMRCQSNRSSEALMNSVGLTLSFHDPHCKLSRYFSLWRPSLSSYLSFPSSPISPDHVFSTRAPGKLVAVDVFISLVYDIPLLLKILSRYFSSLSMNWLTDRMIDRLMILLLLLCNYYSVRESKRLYNTILFP